MKLKFQTELWKTIATEMRLLIPLHWAENANFRDSIPLDPDYRFFEQEKLEFLTARDEHHRLMGYYISSFAKPPNYKEQLFSYVYGYYLLPAARTANNGVLMIQAYERFAHATAKALGQKQICLVGRARGDNYRLFAWLGWTEAEVVPVKLLKVVD